MLVLISSPWVRVIVYEILDISKFSFVWCVSLQRPEGAPEIQVAVCYQKWGCWRLNSGVLQEQDVLLNAESSLQLHFVSFVSSFLRNK